MSKNSPRLAICGECVCVWRGRVRSCNLDEDWRRGQRRTYVADQVVFPQLETVSAFHHHAQEAVGRRDDVLARKHLITDGGGGLEVVNGDAQAALRPVHLGGRVVLGAPPAASAPVLVLNNDVQHEGRRRVAARSLRRRRGRRCVRSPRRGLRRGLRVLHHLRRGLSVLLRRGLRVLHHLRRGLSVLLRRGLSVLLRRGLHVLHRRGRLRRALNVGHRRATRRRGLRGRVEFVL
jgi:hypothetical protein